ncbi:MAG: DegT/DnrJ/EryC1/StrS aminotransferase family protein [Leptospira sp.]|nr:DegT/DnrJ/EryC1/StrS aminotransferase family protein [Leptospira sp.]
MIPLMKFTFINEVETRKALADFLLKSPKLSMDVQCLEFEKRFAEMQGKKDAILFNSGGSANLAILQTLKNCDILRDGDRIGFSALTWSTNTMPIIQLGFEPIAVDCNRLTLNVMCENLKKAHEKFRLKAFFVTNVLGFAGDLDQIRTYCEKENIILFEDNCEALGTELETGKTGNFGVMSSFSFFVAHHMSTIEGGMVVTDDEQFSEMLRIVRANGWDRNLTSEGQIRWRKKYNIKSEFEAKYTFYDLGYNFRPTEITGFLGNLQLNYLKDNIAARERNYLRLEKIVASNAELLLLDRSHLKVLSNFAFPVLCKSPELRNKYLNQCSGAGVEIRPMIAGNMQRQPFYSKYTSELSELPDTDFIHDNGFYFGNYPELSEFDLETLSTCLRNY